MGRETEDGGKKGSGKGTSRNEEIAGKRGENGGKNLR